MISRGFEGVRRVALAAALAATGSLVTQHAMADVSSWLFVGSGPSWIRHNDDNDQRWSLQLETGMGTPATDPVVIGGLLRTHTHFGAGTDLAVLVRGTSASFVNGGWGGAIDVGPYFRFWGAESNGAAANLVLGAPWGITLSVGGTVGSNDMQSASAVLGIDFARLTVYRTAGQAWWKNAFPAGD